MKRSASRVPRAAAINASAGSIDQDETGAAFPAQLFDLAGNGVLRFRTRLHQLEFDVERAPDHRKIVHARASPRR